MSNLYKDAILDAKALRASAMANAKAALEEAFEPKIQEMISKHLSEEEEIEEGYGEEEKMEEATRDLEMTGSDWSDYCKRNTTDPGCNEGVDHEEQGINEEELDEILNQLEELDSHEKDAQLKEAEEGEEEGEEEESEEGEGDESEGEEGEDEGEAEGEEDVTDETKVIDITLGDLKQVLQSVMPATPDTTTPEPEGEEADDEAEVSLEEILDELEAEGMEDPANYSHGKQAGTVEESLIKEDMGVIQKILGQVSPEDLEMLKTVLMSGGGVAALVSALKAMVPGVKDAFGSRAINRTKGPGLEEKKHDMEEAKHKKEDEKELDEAKATIETLRKDLQEVNLLNAKYLYMNKLFKSKSLTESEKVKVINALDRATNVKEVKLTYETLKESFEKKKETIKESIGFASKPAGVAPKANIMEADQFISRWQKLAGIK